MAESETAAVESPSTAESADVGTLDTGTETQTETTEPTAPAKESEPETFMSPAAQRLKAQQQPAAPEPKKRMPDSARAKLEADLRAKLEADTPWIKGLSPEAGANVRRLYDLGERNPLGLVDALVQQMAASPLYRSQLEGYLRQFSQPAKAQPEDAEPGPDIPTSESNGQPVVYSAPQQKKWGEWQKRQILAEHQKQLAPLLQDHQQRQATQQSEQENRAFTQGIQQRQMNRPGFQANAAKIQTAFNALPRPWNTDGQGRSVRELQLLEENALTEAYYTVLNQQAKDDAAKQIAQDLKNKQGNHGATGTGSTAVAGEAGPPKNMRESMSRVKKRFGIAE